MCQELTSPPSPAPHRFLPHRPAALSPHTPHCPLLAARPGPARARGCGGARSYSERTDDSKDKKRRCGTAPPPQPGLPALPPHVSARSPGPGPAASRPRAARSPPGPSGGAGLGAALGGAPRSSPAAGRAAGPARGGPESERSGAASRRQLRPPARPRLPRARALGGCHAGRAGSARGPALPTCGPAYLAAGAAPAPPGASASARVFSTSRDESPRGAAPERGSMSGALPPPSRGRPPPERAGFPHPARPGGGGEGAAGPIRAGPPTQRGPGAGRAAGCASA